MSLLLKLTVLAAMVAVAHGHGWIVDPIARSAIYQRPEFGTQPPYDWNYSGLECGGQDMQYSTCGRCGSQGQWGDTSRYNQGGEYDKGVVVATYQAGAVVTMTTGIAAGHYGYFEVELCPQETETDNCFQKLPIVSASQEVRDGNRVCVPWDNGGEQMVTAQVWLPAGVRCNRCTIRWTYRTSYPGRPDWDFCENPTPTQVFRNCADVRIE